MRWTGVLALDDDCGEAHFGHTKAGESSLVEVGLSACA